MPSQESDRVAAFLARWLETGADSAHIAEAVAAACREIDSALTPIIGSRGVAALFKRSLHLTGRGHSWVAAVHERAGPGLDIVTLKSILSAQSGADAAAGGALFLETFNTLLADLIGPSLTERLLRSVWATM